MLNLLPTCLESSCFPPFVWPFSGGVARCDWLHEVANEYQQRRGHLWVLIDVQKHQQRVLGFAVLVMHVLSTGGPALVDIGYYFAGQI